MTTEAFHIPGVNEGIPANAEQRIAELMKLPLKKKMNLIPSFGDTFRVGPFVFKVTGVNPGQLRFTASLADVIIEGINDGVSPIINPHTGKVLLKQ